MPKRHKTTNKIAVVGLGNISSRHRKNIKKIYPDSYVYAVSASGNLPNYEVNDADKVCLSLDELPIEQLHFAIVASPATLHKKHSLKFINAGIPTLIEKPLTATDEDAEEILKAIKRTKTTVVVGYCLRYLESASEIKNLLKSNFLGKIYNVDVNIGQYLPDWRPNKNFKQTVSSSKKLGGGALLELSHEIDYLNWLFGELDPIAAILRSSKELDLDVEDLVDILAKTSDTVVTIHLDFLQKQAYRCCRIIGENGVLEWNLIQNTIFFTNHENKITVYDGSNVDKNKIYLDMLVDFEARISKQKNNCIEVEEALTTVCFINKVKNIARIC